MKHEGRRRDLALERVDAVLDVARSIADPAHALGREAREALVRSSGLSAEGVELALSRHLETHASPRDLEGLLAWAGDAPRCHVVLSANVCTAAVRAIAIAAAAAPTVFVRPSRREPGLAFLLARELSSRGPFAAAGGSIEVVREIEPAEGDHVWAYGRDATLVDIARSLPIGVRFVRHGAGFGVAYVGRAADLDEAAHALACDIVPFDQAGCLSPRVAIVGGEPGRGEAFARDASMALGELGTRIPRGRIGPDVQIAVARLAETFRAVGCAWQGLGHTVTFDPSPTSFTLPPAGRALHVVSAADPGAIGAWLAPAAALVTSIGHDEGSAQDDTLRQICSGSPGARSALLGEMQRPPLDGPVDRRSRG